MWQCNLCGFQKGRYKGMKKALIAAVLTTALILTGCGGNPKKEALKKAAAQAEERGWKLSQEKNKWYQAELAKNGMETIQPTVELKEGLSVIGKRMLEDWLKKAGADGQAMIDAYKKQ